MFFATAAIAPDHSSPLITGDGAASQPYTKTRRDLLLILLLAIPLLFVGMNSWGFLDPDEGRYAEIPREMLESGDFITPTLNYVKYFEKPPLLYWLTALCFKVFGEVEWAGRLVPAVSALAGLFLTYALGRRMFGPRAGLLGTIILATTAIWVTLGRMLLIDMLLSVTIYAALAFWWLGHTERSLRSRWYFYAFWVSLGLGVMSKGPVAVVLVGGAIFLYMALFSRWSALRGMQWGAGLALFLLITAPWFTVVAMRNPEFNDFFWYGQNVKRFLGKGENREHVKTVYWFVQLWIPVTLPWSFFVPGAIAMAWRHWQQRGRGSRLRDMLHQASETERAAAFAFISGVFIVLFFSASTSKLIPYILPAVPFQALLLGAFFDRTLSNRDAWRRWPVVGGALCLGLVLILSAIVGAEKGPDLLWKRESLPGIYIWAICAVGLVWGLVLIGLALSRRLPALLATLTVGATIFFGVILFQVAAIAPHRSLKPMLTYIEPGLQQGADLIIYETYTQSVNFYPRSRIVLVRDFMFNKVKKRITEGDAGEITRPGMDGLSEEERQKWFPHGIDALRAKLLRPEPVYCVVNDHDKAQYLMKKLGQGIMEITYNNRRAVIGNAAAARLTPPEEGGVIGREQRRR